MNLEKYNFENYLRKEYKFWKSMRAVYLGEKSKNSVIINLKKRFEEKFIIDMAKKRLNNLITLIKLFKEKYKKLIIERINKKLELDLKEIEDLEKIPPSPGTGLYSWGWVEVAIVAAIIIIVLVAEYYDNNGEGEDDTVIIIVSTEALQELVAEEAYLECEEIMNMNYSSWTTYLVMVQCRNNTVEYMKALMCAGCGNLRTIVESFNHDHQLILPEGLHWGLYFLYAARLEECGIPF